MERVGHVLTAARLSLVIVLAGLTAGCLGGSDSQKPDPVVVEDAVAFVKRPLLFNNGQLIGDDLADPTAFRPGARLFLKRRASPDATARDLSSGAFAGDGFRNDEGELLYDVKDLSVAPDGTRLVFAMRAPEIEDADDDEQPTWNIWEYDAETDQLRRVIASNVTAEAGHDVTPAYLPDGRIVFASTRQRTSRAVLLDEGKPQYPALAETRQAPAFVLHVMDSDGSGIEQITFNQSHDLDPAVMDDGTIVFSRWDNAGQTGNNGVNLYHVNPDGTGLTYLYGRHSHDSAGDGVRVEYLRPLLTDTDKLLVQLRPFETDNFGSIPIEVDVAGFVEADLAIDGTAGEGQVPLVTGLALSDEVSLKGHYGAVSPLLDGTGRYLVSWSPCRLSPIEGDGPIVNCTEARIASGDYQPAPPVYGLWLLDVSDGTQRPIESPAEGQQFDEAVLMKGRTLPGFIPDAQYSGEQASLADAGFGVIHIRSVYDIDGVDTSPLGIAATADPASFPPADLPARFVRIEKPVSIPDDDVRDFDNSAFGRSQAQSMREILGYVPVEPDGSVRVAVPANVAFAISVLDDSGQRTSPRHQNWLQLRPGETVECNGCHTPNSNVPHGRPDAGPASVYNGAATTGVEFPNTEPTLFADMGETMAQTYARINGTRRLTPDPAYQDQWTDAAVVPKADSFAYGYDDLETPSPLEAACAAEWSSLCRIVLNYETHIHPLWNLDREILDDDGVTVLDDFTCTGCHTGVDDMGAVRVPEAQLDLTDGPSTDDPDHFKSYRELLFTDNEQEVVDGALVDVLVDTGEFETDEDGELILDGEGNPIPILVTVPVPASMSTAGARASNRFMSRFEAGGSHEGFLTPAELRLIAEWLDIGAQYFNNPFDAPAD